MGYHDSVQETFSVDSLDQFEMLVDCLGGESVIFKPGALTGGPGVERQIRLGVGMHPDERRWMDALRLKQLYLGLGRLPCNGVRRYRKPGEQMSQTRCLQQAHVHFRRRRVHTYLDESRFDARVTDPILPLGRPPFRELFGGCLHR